jgi:phage terminase large subunit GpA-like protein
VAGVSRIEKAYLEGDERRYHVPCIHCGHMAPIEWKNIRWPEGKRAEAYLVCEKCGGIMHDHDKPRLLGEGRWKATAEGDGRTASFHLSALYSPFLTWAEVAIEHGAARNDPPRMQAWQNLMLGEPYEDVAAQPVTVDWLAARAESYEHAPQGVAVVTAGVDVQDDRIEIELVGFGLGDESWSLDYRVLYGDPAVKSFGRNWTRCCVNACRMHAAVNCGSVPPASTAAATTPLRFTTSSVTSSRAAYGPAKVPHVLACRRGRAGRYASARTASRRSISSA